MNKNINVAIITIALMLAPGALRVAAITDTWSAGGGAWVDSNQPEWVSDNLLHPDAASNNGAVLHSSEHPMASSSSPSGGLYGTFFYTFFSAPTFTLSTDNVLSGLSTITFSLSYAIDGATPIDNVEPTLNFNANNQNLIADSRVTGDSEVVYTGPLFGDMTFATFTYTWFVGDLGGTDSFSLSWDLPAHNSFNEINLVQTAVPEPVTYAAIVGGLILAGTLWARRRRM